jgi:hypothetical protein
MLHILSGQKDLYKKGVKMMDSHRRLPGISPVREMING